MRDIEKNTISFMFPVTSEVMGGVQMLLINLIPYIVKNNLANVRLYDYTFGLVKLELDKLGIDGYEFVKLDDSQWSIPNLGNEIFILTDGLWLSYPRFLKNKKNVRIAVWDVCYTFWSSLGKFKGIRIPGLRKKLMYDLAKNNAVLFMEEKGLEVFQNEGYYSKRHGECIVPVPVYIKDKNLYLENFNSIVQNQLRIAYIGRAVDWKMYPVKKILEDLSELNYQVLLYIYTNDKKAFEAFLGKTPFNVEVKYKVGCWGEDLERDLIHNNITFGYSMGTAALDMAKLGIPTVLADFAYEEFPQEYNYRLLHDTGLGNLGENAIAAGSDQRSPLRDILSLDKEEWSKLSFRFVRDKHSIDVCSNKLIAAITQSSLQAEKTTGFKYMVYFLYYISKRLFKRSRKYFGWGIM